ncbi:hypothetical protein LCGC14_2064870, partial [marine sediment metagenome]
MFIEKDKIKCRECDWEGKSDEELSAPSPFERDETIYACPQCKDINSTFRACDEPECWRETSCGTPVKGGYRRTCGKHKPSKTMLLNILTVKPRWKM